MGTFKWILAACMAAMLFVAIGWMVLLITMKTSFVNIISDPIIYYLVGGDIMGFPGLISLWV